jgi:hypothetical protein
VYWKAQQAFVVLSFSSCTKADAVMKRNKKTATIAEMQSTKYYGHNPAFFSSGKLDQYGSRRNSEDQKNTHGVNFFPKKKHADRCCENNRCFTECGGFTDLIQPSRKH